VCDQPTTQYERRLVSQEKCPRCRGALDTGWECTSCCYDAKPIADELNAEREAALNKHCPE
jgi:hypothetical protein